MVDLDISGLIAIIVFYLLILAVGMWAARKSNNKDTEEVMLAGRNIGVFVGIFTMTATWVGGGYINGTAEMLYKTGLVWCQAPFGYSLSLVLGGLLFAEKMRQQGYVTMLDPFQQKYGQRIGGLMFIPALCGEVFWSAAILSALGATLAVILDIPNSASVIISACIAVFYTFFGGLYAVAYTDVVQLICIFIGLWICIPYAMTSDKTGDITLTADQWIGDMGELPQWCNWVDTSLLLIFGGIPWQVYFQRVLSSKDPIRAKMLSYVAAIGCIVMAVPPVLIGAIARATEWDRTGYDPYLNGTRVPHILPNDTNMVLPLVLQQLTPGWVSFVGLGAVSAAVMSSADSSILSAASMFARNVWKLTIRPRASEREILYVMRGAVIVVGIMATYMALTVNTIYGLWFLCADLVYVILFPQLTCVVYYPNVNSYGALTGYLVGLVMRISGGESLLNLYPLVRYPMYDEVANVQYFPFKTLCMCSSMIALIGTSYVVGELFHRGILPAKYDILRCAAPIYVCGHGNATADENVVGWVRPSDTRDQLAMADLSKDGSNRSGPTAADGENGVVNPLLGANKKPSYVAATVGSVGSMSQARPY